MRTPAGARKHMKKGPGCNRGPINERRKHMPVTEQDTRRRQILPDDTARVRLTDKLTSHMAGDSSARRLVESARNILTLVRDNGPMVGSEINAQYAVKIRTADWKRIHQDSPRKRAGDLARRNLLAERPPRIGLTDDPETEYELTLAGLEALELSE